MRSRTSTRRIVFRRPLSVEGLDGLLPAGTYSVETKHDCGWRRMFG